MEKVERPVAEEAIKAELPVKPRYMSIRQSVSIPISEHLHPMEAVIPLPQPVEELIFRR